MDTVLQLRWGTAVFFFKGAGEIFFIGKAAGIGDLLDGQCALGKQLQRAVHAELGKILLGRDTEVSIKGSLQAGRTEKALFTHCLNIQG